MKLQLKDYAHLYFGCDIYLTSNLEGNPVYEKLTIRNLQHIHEMAEEDLQDYPEEKLTKLILRPLSDMTHEEFNEIFGSNFGDKYSLAKIDQISESLNGLFFYLSQYANHNTIPQLLSMGFDLFGLIEGGIALDKKTCFLEK